MLNHKKTFFWVSFAAITTVIITLACLLMYLSGSNATKNSLLVKLSGSNDLGKINKFSIIENNGSIVTITDNEDLKFLKKYTYSHKYPSNQLHNLLVFPSEHKWVNVSVSNGKTFNMYLMEDGSIVLQFENSYDVYTAKKKYRFNEKILDGISKEYAGYEKNQGDEYKNYPKYSVNDSVFIKNKNGEILLDAEYFDKVQVFDADKQLGVLFTLTDAGKDLFSTVTEEYIGQALDLCAGDEVISSPQVVEAITDGRVLVSVENLEKAQEIVNFVKSE